MLIEWKQRVNLDSFERDEWWRYRSGQDSGGGISPATGDIVPLRLRPVRVARDDPRDEVSLATALEDAVGVPVDLRDLSEAPLELRGRVLEEDVRICSGDPARRVALERYVLARYHDCSLGVPADLAR